MRDQHLISEIDDALDSAKTSDDQLFAWAARSIKDVSSEEERNRLRDKQNTVEKRIGNIGRLSKTG